MTSKPESWASFFEMGGYGAFVWPCYVIALVMLGGYAAYCILQHRRYLKALARATRPAESIKPNLFDTITEAED